MLRLLIDENFNHRILRGLRLRFPNLEYLVVQESELRGLKDPPLLAWAAEHDRILVTHDLATIPKNAYERVRAGQHMPGVIAISKTISIGQAIDELMIVIECLTQDECLNQVVHHSTLILNAWQLCEEHNCR